MSMIDTGRLLTMRTAIIEQNQALQRAAGRGVDGADAAANGADFSGAIEQALRSVSDQQGRASALSEAYERGDTHDIVAVMVERQRASPGL